MIADGLAVYADAYRRGVLPDPALWIDEWAENFGRIPRGAGAEYGKYRVERTPYAREVMRCLSPGHPCRRVVAKVGSQLFKTQVAINWLMACIHQVPDNMLVLEPTDKIAKRVSARIDKTIRDIPQVRERVAKPRSRDSRNTMDTKEFDGGTMYITTAGSPANLAEVPIRFIYADEINRWVNDVGGEGSGRELAEARASTYGRNAKIYYTSSPTIEGASEIDDLYNLSDKRVFEVPCPHCGGRQVLEWKRMRRTEDLRRIWYECLHCNAEILEDQKPKMLREGIWTPTAQGDGETVGFHLNALYAPIGWQSWEQLTKKYLAAESALEDGDTTLMQVFWNTRLALSWDVISNRIKGEQIQAVAEDFPLGTVPEGALILTGAVDVQGNRLELLVLGWGPGMERWTVAKHIVKGDPTDAETWKSLDDILLTPIANTYGVPMPIRAVAIDSGHWTQDVYDFCRPRRRRQIAPGKYQDVFAIKGDGGHGKAIMASSPKKVDITMRGKPDKFGVELWLIGTNAAKDQIYPNLLNTSGNNGIHYSNELERDWFEQLVAEVKIIRHERGKRYAVWDNPQRKRNEAWDLMVYNLAMAYHLELRSKSAAFWAKERATACPPTRDLFAQGAQPAKVEDKPVLVVDRPIDAKQDTWVKPRRESWIRR